MKITKAITRYIVHLQRKNRETNFSLLIKQFGDDCRTALVDLLLLLILSQDKGLVHEFSFPQKGWFFCNPQTVSLK